MLTIKHIEKHQGIESIVQAISLSTVPASTEHPYGIVKTIHYQDHRDLGNHMNVPGKVYVMNENGKTVATYDIAEYESARSLEPAGVPIIQA